MTAATPLFAPQRPTHPVCIFTVMGEPVPCGRPRSEPYIMWEGGKPVARVRIYPDPKSDAYEQVIRDIARAARPPGWRIDWAAYDLRIRVYQSERGGDGDNFLKAAADGCCGKRATKHEAPIPPALWENDSRVRSWRVDILDELDPRRARLEVLAAMVGEHDLESDRKARARQLAARRRDGR